MVKRSKKKRPSTYASLKNKLDGVFSEWVRRKDGDYPKCITCGAVHNWKAMQCGHFISRVHLATRWDERNCAPQCFADNVWKRGSPAEFSLWITTKYGPNIIQELVNLKHQSVKFTRADLQEKIDEYRKRLLSLENA